MTNPANLSHEQILALKANAAERSTNVNITTGTPNTSGGWGGRDSAPRVQAPGTGEKAIAMSHLPRVSAPSANLAERFKLREKEDADKRLKELEEREARRENEAIQADLVGTIRRQDAVIGRLEKKLKALEKVMKDVLKEAEING